MDIENFLWFIEERENIRLKKEAGLPKPWSEDFILHKCHFLNLNTIHDPGTIRLHQFINCKTNFDMLFYIFLYRTCFSNPLFLEEMTGVWFHDYRNIQLLYAGLYSDHQPYSYFIGKHNTLTNFLFNIAYPVFKSFQQSFSSFNVASIVDVEEELSTLFKQYTGRRRMSLLSSIISNDIALQFPSSVNPDSQCNLSITTRQALKKIDGGRIGCKMEKLRHSTGLNYSSLNRALSEWFYYLQRKKFFKEKGYIRGVWLYLNFL